MASKLNMTKAELIALVEKLETELKEVQDKLPPLPQFMEVWEVRGHFRYLLVLCLDEFDEGDRNSEVSGIRLEPEMLKQDLDGDYFEAVSFLIDIMDECSKGQDTVQVGDLVRKWGALQIALTEAAESDG